MARSLGNVHRLLCSIRHCGAGLYSAEYLQVMPNWDDLLFAYAALTQFLVVSEKPEHLNLLFGNCL